MKEKLKQNLKQKPNQVVLIIALVLCLLSGIISNVVLRDFGNVNVTNIAVQTEIGTIRGYLLVPEIATAENKVPAIVVSHGSSASAETVESWYIELARRGYVVFAPNLYGHGDSSVADASYDGTAAYETRGLLDAVEYVNTLSYVDTTKVGITGHSLGGECSLKVAAYYTQLERDALAKGATAEEAHALNKLDACLPVGYPLEVVIEGWESAGSFEGYECDLGVILGSADDFNSWLTIDILTNETGVSWLKTQTGIDVSEIEEGKFYENEETGYNFAMWNPAEIHNQNWISTTTTKYIIDYFEETFGAPIKIDSSNQIWTIKLVGGIIGLVGFFLFIIPCLFYVLKISVFNCLERENTFVLPPLLGKARTKYLKAIITGALINTALLLPFVLIGMLMMESPVFPQASTNGFAIWGVACGLVTLFSVRRGTGLKYRENAEYYGIKTNAKELLRVFLLALTVMVLTFMTVFGVKYIFNTDFRFWSYAIRPFDFGSITIALRYLPLFFIQQFANGVAIRRNNFDNWSDKKRIAFSTTMALVPIVLMLLISYVPIIFTGSPLWAMDGSNMLMLAAGQSAIKVISYIFSIGLTSFIHVKSQKYTGNIWAGTFICAIMTAMISVANCNSITGF